MGVIGGSGLYNLPELQEGQWHQIDSTFGQPSDQFLFGEIAGVSVAFVPRHGRGHILAPRDINYRANIDALKRCGVEDIISVSAVGSLDDSLPPGMFVLVDQYVDRTHLRESSFFGVGCVAHVSMADPVSREMNDIIAATAKDLGIDCRLKGTYLAMEGPQFSARSESELYRSWGCNVIGMTNMPEAKLAREAEICYASICMVTDYDCWHPSHDAVVVTDVVKVMNQNATTAQRLLVAAIPRIANSTNRERWNGRLALENAIITAAEMRDASLCQKLDAVAGRVLRGGRR